MSMKKETTSALKAMLHKNSGHDATTVRAAIKELKRRGEPTPPASMVTGGRNLKNPDAPPSRPKNKMSKGGDTKPTRDVKIGTRAEMIKMAKELGFTKAEMEKVFGKNYSKGGKATKKVPVISIGVGMAEVKPGKAKMNKGGMANGKMHMYTGGGAVKDNAGLRALKASGPKGLEAYNKITKS